MVTHPGQSWNWGVAMVLQTCKRLPGSFVLMENYFDPFMQWRSYMWKQKWFFCYHWKVAPLPLSLESYCWFPVICSCANAQKLFFFFCVCFRGFFHSCGPLLSSTILIYKQQLHALSTFIFLPLCIFFFLPYINEVFLSYCPDFPYSWTYLHYLQLLLGLIWPEFDTDS